MTGHTGFKGAWLSHLLLQRGHAVSGLALDPLPGSIFERTALARRLERDLRIDIRDRESLTAAVASTEPDVVLHLAAQPLVRESYRAPRATIETNVMGTINLLESVAAASGVRAVLIVTTDKVYRNVGNRAGYTESDALGGVDPYSASKAAADLLTQSWLQSFPSVPTAIARAGNVIGGGDVSGDRLLVDLVRGFQSGEAVRIRYPEAVRPWQHVLDCVNGYLTLTDALLAGGAERGGEWNFGPDPDSFQSVREIADAASTYWGEGAAWTDDSGEHPHEAAYLTLDSSKAQERLRWRNLLSYPSSLEWTLDWYRAAGAEGDANLITRTQLDRFEELASTPPEPDV